MGISGARRVGSSSSAPPQEGSAQADAMSPTGASPSAPSTSAAHAGPVGSGRAALRQRDRSSALRVQRTIERQRPQATKISARKPPLYPGTRLSERTLAAWLPFDKEAADALSCAWRGIVNAEPAARHFLGLLRELNVLPDAERSGLIEDGMWVLLERMAHDHVFRAQALELCASHQGTVESGQGALHANLLFYHQLCHLSQLQLAGDELRETHQRLLELQNGSSMETPVFKGLVQQQEDNFDDLITLGVISSRLERIDGAIDDYCRENNLSDSRDQDALRWRARLILNHKADSTEGINLQTGYVTPGYADFFCEHDQYLAAFVFEAMTMDHEEVRDHVAKLPVLQAFFKTCEPQWLAAHVADVREEYDRACAQRLQQPGIESAGALPPRLCPPHGKEPRSAAAHHVLDVTALELARDLILVEWFGQNQVPQDAAALALQQACEQTAMQRLVHQQMRSSKVLQALEDERKDVLQSI